MIVVPNWPVSPDEGCRMPSHNNIVTAIPIPAAKDVKTTQSTVTAPDSSCMWLLIVADKFMRVALTYAPN
jgi:hypothetical protein